MYIIFQKTYSPAVIQLKPENISFLRLRRTHVLSNMRLVMCKSYVIAYQTLQEDRVLETRFTNATSHNAFLIEVNFLFTI